jgi:hypothetical protein
MKIHKEISTKLIYILFFHKILKKKEASTIKTEVIYQKSFHHRKTISTNINNTFLHSMTPTIDDIEIISSINLWDNQADLIVFFLIEKVLIYDVQHK